MTPTTLHAPDDNLPPVRADQLVAGDHIAPGFLPTGQAADVTYVEQWVAVVYRYPNGETDTDYFLADGLIWVDTPTT